MSRTRIPDDVLEAAHERARARAGRDWGEADRLKAEIEAAGWKVVDRGTDFALSPAKPPDVAGEGRIRFGSSSSVPSRLDDPATGLATVVLVVTANHAPLERATASLEETAPVGTSVVIVVDRPGPDEDAAVEETEARASDGDRRLAIEIVRTSDRLGPAAAVNIGIRRASGPVVVVLDPDVELIGDIVTPLVRALDDPTVAVVGGWGSVTRDRRHFEEAPPGDVDVIDGALVAFRRADAADRGPLDERLRTDVYTAISWSLTLRDEGEGGAHRRAVVLPEMPAIRPNAEMSAAPGNASLARDLRRDFYKYLDRFGSRPDLFGGPDHDSGLSPEDSRQTP